MRAVLRPREPRIEHGSKRLLLTAERAAVHKERWSFRRGPVSVANILEPDPGLLPTVRRVFDLSAGGMTDRAVAEAVGLTLFTVRGTLTSPLYSGRLRDGRPARWPPLVPHELWGLARARRELRGTNTGRPADPRRPYALEMLHCGGCGRRLTGDTGYYRHRDPCPQFLGARPPARGGRGRTNGHAYRMELYEQIVEILLAQASVGATTLTSVVGQVAAEAGNRDDTALVGAIERERERALSRYRRDRDTGALDLAMRELDRQEADERRVRSEEAVPAHVAVTYLRELPETWRQAGGGHGRRLLASALFERIEVLGLREATFYPTAEAARHGLAASIPTEIGISVSGRGERI